MHIDEYQERRKFGFWSSASRIIFIVWHMLMLKWVFSSSLQVSDIVQLQSPDPNWSAGLAMLALWSYVLFVWTCGTIILGFFVLCTPPNKHYIPFSTIQR